MTGDRTKLKDSIYIKTMSQDEISKEVIRQSLLKGVPLSQIRKYCIDHSIPEDIIDEVLIELEFTWRRDIDQSIIMLSGWNAFEESLTASQEAIRDIKEWQSEKRSILNLIFGIFIGIIGNVFASSLLEAKFIPSLISLILLIVPSVWYIHSFMKMHSEEKEYKDFAKECFKNLDESQKQLQKRIQSFRQII